MTREASTPLARAATAVWPGSHLKDDNEAVGLVREHARRGGLGVEVIKGEAHIRERGSLGRDVDGAVTADRRLGEAGPDVPRKGEDDGAVFCSNGSGPLRAHLGVCLDAARTARSNPFVVRNARTALSCWCNEPQQHS